MRIGETRNAYKGATSILVRNFLTLLAEIVIIIIIIITA
jgi:hypothetical protein